MMAMTGDPVPYWMQQNGCLGNAQYMIAAPTSADVVKLADAINRLAAALERPKPRKKK